MDFSLIFDLVIISEQRRHRETLNSESILKSKGDGEMKDYCYQKNLHFGGKAEIHMEEGRDLTWSKYATNICLKIEQCWSGQ